MKPGPIFIGEAARQQSYARWRRRTIAADAQMNKVAAVLVAILLLRVVAPTVAALLQGHAL